ncbi:hypothetical protein [Thiobacillus sp.]
MPQGGRDAFLSESKAQPYHHLLDGGITDNIGLYGMLDRVARARSRIDKASQDYRRLLHDLQPK